MNKNFEQYIGQNVELQNVRFDNYIVENPDGGKFAKTKWLGMGNDLHILCTDSSGLILLSLIDFDSFWDFGTADLVNLCLHEQIKTISGKGVVQPEKFDWKNNASFEFLKDGPYKMMYFRKVPAINLDSISWKYTSK